VELTVILHADLSQRVVVDTRAASWVHSPEPGVDRILLERDGGEVARATSIVRYAPGSKFAAHEHGRGEEILVLDGELRDEHGSYPAGTYLRSPWGSRHAPFSPQGCTLFVKLRQIPESDLQRLCVQRAVARCVLAPGRDELEIVLHASEGERVALARWRAGHAAARHGHPDGEEILVLDGGFEDEHGRYPTGAWVRQPAGSAHQPRTSGGCLLYVRRGLR
jgi:anti-sigma factor ChrR (cupin superfamily)